MAEDGYFGDAALGYIAGAISGRLNAEAALDIAHVFEKRFGRPQPEVDVEEVIHRYNELVAEFNRVVGVAKQWMSWGEDRKQDIARLKQELAQANQRAAAAEAREAAAREAYRLLDVTYGNVLDRLERLRHSHDELAREMKALKDGGAPS